MTPFKALKIPSTLFYKMCETMNVSVTYGGETERRCRRRSGGSKAEGPVKARGAAESVSNSCLIVTLVTVPHVAIITVKVGRIYSFPVSFPVFELYN